MVESTAVMAFCSQVAQAAGYHPIGTAPTFHTHLALECPLPWEREVTDSATFPTEVGDVITHATEDGIEHRITGLMPDPEYMQAGLTRLFSYAHTDDQSPIYAKREYLVPPARLSALVEALLYDKGLQEFDAYEQATGHIRELFVCNHGSRDRCCATFGFPIYRELREVYARAQPDALRVWRCSHLGGHRMAPTLLDFPEGRYYAYVTTESLPNLIGREGSFAALESQYRGWSKLSPLEQAAEHAVLLVEDWPWTTYGVKSAIEVANADDGASTVTLTYTAPDSTARGTYQVKVREAPERTLSFPSSCGKEDEPQPQFVVEGIEKLP
ncbi:MAG: hypothetical protein OXM03_07445 [Chloroflexota bacterium]|nr:hypothetical protein [Chloroflexota bacterium]